MARAPNVKAKANAARRVIGGESIDTVAAVLRVAPEDVQAWSASFDLGGFERLRRDFPARSSQPAYPRPHPGLTTVADALAYARPKLGETTYGGYLSNALAMVMANALRGKGFEGVLPDERGGFESRARSAKGLKKLDVNYSSPEMGLGLGLSIKTISSRDPGTKRYTKNYSRNDNELRAETVDYHRRQPWSVLVAFLFLPFDAADDAGQGKLSESEDEAGVSSFGAAVRYFRHRTPRLAADDEPDLFECFFVCLYEPNGDACYWPVHDLHLSPPRARRPNPNEQLTLDDAVVAVHEMYTTRNYPPFAWAAD